jgi:hypothetical protein
MKRVETSSDKTTKQAQPSAAKTGPKQPKPHDGKKSDTAERIEEVKEDGDETVPRSHENAVEAQRQPVAAPRSQDADPEANKGVTITQEAGKPVAHPGSTLR